METLTFFLITLITGIGIYALMMVFLVTGESMSPIEDWNEDVKDEELAKERMQQVEEEWRQEARYSGLFGWQLRLLDGLTEDQYWRVCKKRTLFQIFASEEHVIEVLGEDIQDALNVWHGVCCRGLPDDLAVSDACKRMTIAAGQPWRSGTIDDLKKFFWMIADDLQWISDRLDDIQKAETENSRNSFQMYLTSRS